MILQRHSPSVRIPKLSPILGLCALLGCSKAAAPAPVVAVSAATVRRNAGGEVLVQMSVTNMSASAVLIGARSTIYQDQGSWITNFNLRPRFVGLAGPGSEVSDVSLAPGEGITAALSPLQIPTPFRIELVCFPSRLGIPGTVDGAKDKIEEFKDGSQHNTYLGDSFFVLSPFIEPRTEPGGQANRSQPVQPAKHSTPLPAGSGR